MSNAFLISLFEFKAWANRGLYGALCALPQERRAEIAVPIFTLDHAMRVDRLFRARLENKPEPYDTVVSRTMPNLEDLARTVAENDVWYLAYVKSITETELAEPIDFQFVSDPDKGRMTRAEMLAHVITHSHSHRGAVGKMLEPLRIPTPSDMFTTYVSESTRERRVDEIVEKFKAKIEPGRPSPQAVGDELYDAKGLPK